jgi:hypothetical protein
MRRARCPDWDDGIALGIGVVAAYTGARHQARMPDMLIRRLIGVLVRSSASGPISCHPAWGGWLKGWPFTRSPRLG